jgi:hypothetical protein
VTSPSCLIRSRRRVNFALTLSQRLASGPCIHPRSGPLRSDASSSRLCFLNGIRPRLPFRGNASCLRPPFCGSASGGGSCPRLPFRGGASTSRPALPCGGASRLRPPLPYVPGTSASGIAAVALSTPLAGSTPAAPPTRAGATPTTGRARPRSCASTLDHSTSLASVFATVLTSQRWSGSPGLPRNT